MKRTTGFLVLTVIAFTCAVFCIPTSQAERNSNAPQLDARSTASETVQQKVFGDGIAGEPSVLNSRSALSAAVIATVGDRADKSSAVALLGDWDGREDLTADREQTVDIRTTPPSNASTVLTRTAISEHTVANGFNENIYYYGDSEGNFWVGTDLVPGVAPVSVATVDSVRQINLKILVQTNLSAGVTLLEPEGGDCAPIAPTVTGIAVNPVADLGDFDPATLCGVIGEVVYVSVDDFVGCGNDGTGQPFRSRIFAFGFKDEGGALTPVGARQILRSSLRSGGGGVAVDDDGSLYFHLSSASGAQESAIFKATETAGDTTGCATNPRINRVIPNVPGGLTGFAGTLTLGLSQASAITDDGNSTSSPTERVRVTNYSGTSSTFGNIVAMTAAPNNIIYAALAQSFSSGTSADGPFTNPAALGVTPSMIISFADTTGGFDRCSAPDPSLNGTIRIKNGIADAASGSGIATPGVDNFRVFALGNGVDIRGTAAGTAVGATSTTLKVAMQIDPTIHSGLMVDEEGTVFVISGGTPALAGSNPSPSFTEILAFPDCCARDRRADYVDLRGDGVPSPPASGGNVGDGDSDRFDHIFWQAPIDGSTGGPTGAAGLGRGFLRYTHRLAPNDMGNGVALGKTIPILGDDGTTDPLPEDPANVTGTILFSSLDPGHQVSGGDDQNSPFFGDDNDGAGTPVLVGPLLGGFEFTFGGPAGVANSVWNGFFLNGNGNMTFGNGNVDFTPTIPEFRSGSPRIAPAWTDFNSNGRAVTLGSFPVMALGFSGVNSFKVRSINIPHFGEEECSGNSANTFSTTLYDDGSTLDENEAQALDAADPTGDNVDPAFDEQEGPNDFRWVLETNTNTLVRERIRPEGEGPISLEYGQMLLIGEQFDPVLTGISIGNLSASNPPGLCNQNLSEAARAADNSPFGVIQSQTASILPCMIGEGTEPTIYQYFNTGVSPAIGSGGEVIFARPSFDLRAEGNNANISAPAFQNDPNRGNVNFYGVGSAPPPNPTTQVLKPQPFQVAPDQPANLINAVGDVLLDLIGSGYFPNETTTICEGNPPPENAIPIERPGKTVSTAISLSCDVNGDSIFESVVILGTVTPVSKNLVRGTLLRRTSSGFPGTAFPLACAGGNGVLTITTTFTAGDNNVFGPFTRTSTFPVALGFRAPVVLGVSPVSGSANTLQKLSITGSSFIINGVPNVTSVYAEQIDNPANKVTATSFVIQNNNLIEADFNFGPSNAGKTFLIFVTGPNGTSRNLRTAIGTAPAGNEQGNLVTFTPTSAASPGTFIFGTPSVTTSEDVGNINIPITRTGDTSSAVTVDFATADGTATQKGDYIINLGRLRFAAGETSKVIKLLVIDDVFVEGNETLTINLSAPSGGFSSGTPLTITITDNDIVAPVFANNPILNSAFFIRQQYLDFLAREPDNIGFANWLATLNGCPNNGFNNTPGCDRIHVSASFVQSLEFQTRGYFIERFYEVAFGRRPTYLEFMKDLSFIGAFSSPAEEAANKVTYANEFVQRPDFTPIYGGLTNTQFVDTLAATAGVTLPNRDALINDLNTAAKTRAQVLREIVESTPVQDKFFNTAFVLMQYFGYLRRDPDPVGFTNWLNTLNTTGDFRQMVGGFINSFEYRGRFGPPI